MNKKGFTLIELIIVVAIIALLAAATFVAVNPAKRIGEAQDAQRWSDVTAIADAYMKYAVDNSGSYVTSTTNGATYHIATTTGGTHSASHCTATTTTNLVSIAGLITGGYIGVGPTDPTHAYGTEGYHTQYYLYKDANGKVIIGACEKYSGASSYPTVYR